MGRSRVVFRADASATIGYGHFVRTLALASMIGEQFDTIFATRRPTPYQRTEVGAVCDELWELGEDHFDAFLAMLDPSDIVVLDNYFFDTNYQRAVKSVGCKLVCVDDMHDKHYVADVVINHGLTDASLFSVEPYTRLCLGLDWALLRKPFLEAKPLLKREQGHCVVSFGGVDFLNLTSKVASILSAKPTIRKITAIVGEGYASIDALNDIEKVEVRKNLSAEQMADIFCSVEFAVLPASTVCIEAIACCCPVIAGYYVDNQQRPLSMLVANGLVTDIGFFPDIIDIDIENLVYQSSVNSRLIISNYQNLFATIGVTLMPISETHLENTFLWMQDQELKHNFMLKKDVSWESHCKWFSNLINDETQKIWAIYCDGEHVGNIGMKYIDPVKHSAETWIYIGNKQFYGRGIAKKAYKILLYMLRNGSNKSITIITSSIAQWNEVSLSLFLSVGFKVDEVLKDAIDVDGKVFNLYKLSVAL